MKIKIIQYKYASLQVKQVAGRLHYVKKDTYLMKYHLKSNKEEKLNNNGKNIYMWCDAMWEEEEEEDRKRIERERERERYIFFSLLILTIFYKYSWSSELLAKLERKQRKKKKKILHI